MAAREAVSSCGPQPKDQPPPPMAQAPKPRVVIFNPLVPRERVGNVMMSPPFGINVGSWPPINADAELSLIRSPCSMFLAFGWCGRYANALLTCPAP